MLDWPTNLKQSIKMLTPFHGIGFKCAFCDNEPIYENSFTIPEAVQERMELKETTRDYFTCEAHKDQELTFKDCYYDDC